MLRRLRSARIAWVAILLLMFSQLATAAYACAVGPADHMPSMSMGHDEEMEGMDGCEISRKAPPVACKVHCEKDSQSSEVRVPSVSAPVLVALFFIPTLADVVTAVDEGIPAEPPTLVASSPPIRLQYQVFRN